MHNFSSNKTIALTTAVLAFLAPSLTSAQTTETVNTNGVMCPGVLTDNNGDEYCCVGGELTLSVCEGWPICEGPTTVDTATQTESCVTKIPVTQSDYSALISSYMQDSSLAPSSSDATTTAASEASDATDTATGTEQGSSESGESQTAASTGESSSESTSSAASSSSAAGAADRVAGPMGALAGGLLGLAALL